MCKLLLLLVGIYPLLSCEDTPVTIQYHGVEDHIWERGEEQQFVISDLPTSSTYDLSLLLRTTNEYPYKGAIITVATEIYPSGNHRNDTLSCAIYDERGQHNGTGISLQQHSYPLYVLPLTPRDTIIITVRHNMQDTFLRGIADVGIAVELPK